MSRRPRIVGRQTVNYGGDFQNRLPANVTDVSATTNDRGPRGARFHVVVIVVVIIGARGCHGGFADFREINAKTAEYTVEKRFVVCKRLEHDSFVLHTSIRLS